LKCAADAFDHDPSIRNFTGFYPHEYVGVRPVVNHEDDLEIDELDLMYRCIGCGTMRVYGTMDSRLIVNRTAEEVESAGIFILDDIRIRKEREK